jgi:hypothetical protein
MIENPIVEEIHRIREEILAEYGGDLHAMIRDSERKTEELRKAGRVVVTRSPRPVQQAQQPPRKVG